MKRFARALGVTLGLVVLGSIVSLASQKPATGAGGAPVNITSPLPLPVAVTFPLQGTVGVQQTGNWDMNVTNAALPTQDIGGGAATQVGQVASQLVNLVCFPSVCFQVFTDGTADGTAYSIPSGKDLVITDVQWDGHSNNGQGNYASVALVVNGVGAAFFSSQVDAFGVVAGQAHLTTGVVVASGSKITSDNNASFQRYLVPHQ